MARPNDSSSDFSPSRFCGIWLSGRRQGAYAGSLNVATPCASHPWAHGCVRGKQSDGGFADTRLRLELNRIPPTSGTYKLNGRNPSRLPKNRTWGARTPPAEQMVPGGGIVLVGGVDSTQTIDFSRRSKRRNLQIRHPLVHSLYGPSARIAQMEGWRTREMASLFLRLMIEC